MPRKTGPIFKALVGYSARNNATAAQRLRPNTVLSDTGYLRFESNLSTVGTSRYR